MVKEQPDIKTLRRDPSPERIEIYVNSKLYLLLAIQLNLGNIHIWWLLDLLCVTSNSNYVPNCTQKSYQHILIKSILD